MFENIDEIIAEAPEGFDGSAETPAALHLFDIDEAKPTMDAARIEKYHHLTAKLLYLSKRARPDIQTAVSFLCTRVKGPTEDDWKKLQRTIRYLQSSKWLPLTLEAGGSGDIKWWVDASYGVHSDYRGHTGGTLTLGKGHQYSSSTKQKINTRSSTESELVAVDDLMPNILWTRLFIKAQGYKVNGNTIYQDNKSTILLASNGKASSGKRTKHINIRYFFITDRVAKGEVDIKHCPTNNMLADFFSKPIQGSLFREQRKAILNLEFDDITGYGPGGYKPATSQECVGRKSQRNQNEGKSQE